MKHQNLFNQIYRETGLDFSRNRGVKAYLAHLDNPQSNRVGVIIRVLHKAFQPYGDNITAMAAAINCANKYFNGGQIAGFGTYWTFVNGYRSASNGKRADTFKVFLFPKEQLSQITSNSEQALKTFQAIKPETLEKYRQVIHTTNRFRKEHAHGKSDMEMGSQSILY